MPDTPQHPVKTNKNEIYRILSKEAEWVSGEHISQLLGVTRAAVAKQVAVLRKEGHAIKAAPRKGYRLEASANDLDLEAVKNSLGGTFFDEGNWLHLKKTSSTNTECMAIAAKGGPQGSLVYSEIQTAGRGRKATDWFSTPRSLQFSLLLRPGPSFPETAEATASLCEIIKQVIEQETSLTAVLKAPNDICVNGKKMAGVLLETGFRADRLEWVVIGIGINVNALETDFPPQLQKKCTSLLIEQGTTSNRGKILAAILQRIDLWYTSPSGQASR